MKILQIIVLATSFRHFIHLFIFIRFLFMYILFLERM